MNLPKKEKSYTDKEVLMKISSFCSYQERTQKEVREKLYGYGLNKDTVEEIIVKLIGENFLNEERFAKIYAGGKFRIKKWGKKKIQEALKQKDISDYCIRQAIKEIPQDDYIITLKALIEKRDLMEKEKNSYKRKYKIAQYIIGRGFESELVWEILNDNV
ncbi:MAG TPA: regulatory protein RecX [Cytophagaceae bacterium]|jgi:regulatory protein|nr:regulatory protein RecX [Cytophagaceae bacterium]